MGVKIILNLLTYSHITIVFLVVSLALMILAVAPLLYQKIHLANAQYSINKTQIWLDKLNNIKVEFAHTPEKPVTDTPTVLKFDVLNLKTGDRLNNLSDRVIILTSSNGEESFYKYTNVTAPAGNFSVRYIFPTDGVYNVLSEIESKDTSALTLASFPVFVSFQPVGAMNSNMMTQLFLIALLTGVAAAIVIAFFLIVIRKRRKAKKQNL